MNTSPTPRNLSIWLFAAILGAVLTLAPASASVNPDASLTSIEEPAALAEPDAAPGISVLSLSQCTAGQFCIWTEPNYQGTIQRFTTQAQYKSIVLPYVGSFYNRRSTRVFIYGDPSGSPSACYGAQAKKATTTSWMTFAEGTYLSTATSC